MKLKVSIYQVAFFMALGLNLSCSNMQEEEEKEKEISRVEFGVTAEGDTVYQYELQNDSGISMKVITYGGIITHLKTPNKDGEMQDIVLGYDSLSHYVENNPYFGALIGRYGNRIAKGRFTLDTVEYILETNNFGNHLHGGIIGFDKVVWDAEEFTNDNGQGLKLSYLSKHMEEGYPGNLNVTVTYLLTNDNALEIEYEATTDQKTVVNLTQHSYFNLSGDFEQKILDHELMIDASSYLPVDSTLIPTGEIRNVEGTPFDFRQPKEIGKEIDQENQQLEYGLGYDHCWVLDQQGDSLALAATLYHKGSGRFMEVLTTEPGLQFYSGNFLDGTNVGKDAVKYEKRTGLCLETQHFPDSPNKPEWPSTELAPGEKYTSKTVYKFSTR